MSIDIIYKKYMVFNNMMREISFFGASYQYLWHWEKETKTLYRCGKLDVDNDKECVEIKSKEEYVKNMFKRCINHMNKPSKILHSYSENIFIVIYKYLNLALETKPIDTIICDKDEIFIKSSSIENNNVAEFKIIKEADINSIFIDGKAKSFHEFIIMDERLEKYVCPFTVEIFPQSLNTEKNDKGMIKGMRDKLLPEYFNSWGIDAVLKKVIADDKEVITFGKCYNKEVFIDNGIEAEYLTEKSGTLFSLSLSKEDIIYLLLNIYKKKREESINIIREMCKKLHGKYKEQFWENSYISNSKLKISFYFMINNKELCLFEVSVNGNHFKKDDYLDENKKKISIDKANKKLYVYIKNAIEEYFINRYNQILSSNHYKSDFILGLISGKYYNLNFDSAKLYNEYLECDEEIRVLKYILFKTDY